MKYAHKAFTLVEMMVTVAVIVTLMSIVIKLTGVSQSTSRRVATAERLQRVSNCLSGYYAAFGSYPPVKSTAIRDIYAAVDSYGSQRRPIVRNENIWGSGQEAEAWAQVQPVCRAQAMACGFPYHQGREDLVREISEDMKKKIGDPKYKDIIAGIDPIQLEKLKAGFDIGVTRNIGRFSDSDATIYTFGLMSFLVPRYMVMLNAGDASLFDGSTAKPISDQWNANNDLHSVFNGMTGETFANWSSFYARIKSDGTDWLKYIPSQGVCSRWIINLEKICDWGIGNGGGLSYVLGVDLWGSGGELFKENWYIDIHQPRQGSTQNQFVLDKLTVRDGWGNEFYYYSPAPYQSYVLWSAGANGRTFPPWIPVKTLPSAAHTTVGSWVADDITALSH